MEKLHLPQALPSALDPSKWVKHDGMDCKSGQYHVVTREGRVWWFISARHSYQSFLWYAREEERPDDVMYYYQVN